LRRLPRNSDASPRLAQRRQGETFPSEEKTFLPEEKSFLPIEKTFLPIEKSFLPIEKSFLPIEKSFLPIEKSFLPIKKSFLPIKKNFRASGKNFRARGKSFRCGGKKFRCGGIDLSGGEGLFFFKTKPKDAANVPVDFAALNFGHQRSQYMEKIFAAYFRAAQNGKMFRRYLAVDEGCALRKESFGKGQEGGFRGIRPVEKHRFAKEDGAKPHSVTAARKLTVLPGLGGMSLAEPVECRVCGYHVARDPGVGLSGTVRGGAA
jgi:hypothetical protein